MYSLYGIEFTEDAILDYVEKCMKESGKSLRDIQDFLMDALSSDFSHLVYVAQGVLDELNDNRL